MRDQWIVSGGVVAGIGIIVRLIWNVLKLGADQQARLLRPAYDRIDTLEDRVETLEIELRVSQRQLGMARYLLTLNGIDYPRD